MRQETEENEEKEDNEEKKEKEKKEEKDEKDEKDEREREKKAGNRIKETERETSRNRRKRAYLNLFRQLKKKGELAERIAKKREVSRV